MQLEQFFQVMSNMTVNGLTIKNSNIALSPTGGNAPRSVVSVDGAISLANGDRKSTRLNSSHLVISYAVFCLKKTKFSRWVRKWSCEGTGAPALVTSRSVAVP